MGRIVLLTLLAAALGGGLAVAATAGGTGRGTPAPAAFRLADGSAACAFDGERMACRARGLRSAIVLEHDGSSEADDADVSWSAATPVLREAESWWHGGFSCRVEDAQIACDRGAGSISVGAERGGGASSAVSPAS